MKKYCFIIILIITLSCSKNNDELTSINYDGSGGISCLVDDAVLTENYQKTCTIKITTNEYENFQVGFTHEKKDPTSIWNTEYKTVFIEAKNIDRKNLEGSTFQLGSKNNIESYATYNKFSIYLDITFSTNTELIGELKILYYNESKNVIAGTFWFDAKNEQGDIKRVRNGKFDLIIK